jgi:osmotically-inducible protein OsmY
MESAGAQTSSGTGVERSLLGAARRPIDRPASPQVERVPKEKRRTAMVQIRKTDPQIQRDVREELKWDTRIKATDIGVEVREGIVSLTGTVDSWTERLSAQEAAHRVSGVLDVVSHIRIKLPDSLERDDADLARAIRHALEWDVTVPHDRIRTTVSQGVVTLEGSVDFWAHRDDAERCVRHLTGVVEMRNLIVVEAQPSNVSAHRVRIAISGALERRADRAARGVHVAIVDGKVTLTGEVASWVERTAIEDAVRRTPGVCKVDNLIRT